VRRKPKNRGGRPTRFNEDGPGDPAACDAVIKHIGWFGGLRLRKILLNAIEENASEGRVDGPTRHPATMRRKFCAIIARIVERHSLSDAELAQCQRIVAALEEAGKRPAPEVNLNALVSTSEGLVHPPIRRRGKPKAAQSIGPGGA
jgi:hypothetical protein